MGTGIMRRLLGNLASVLRMIRFSHTVFALPFALLSMAWAAGGWPGWRIFLLVLLAMVSARSAAMTFNRIADLRFDRENPRTVRWPLASGEVSLAFAWGFLVAAAGLFFAAAWALNLLALALAPVALAALLGYSLTKRFTWTCHAFLGLALGIAAPGAWIAVRGSLSPAPVWLGLGVLCWVAGFDVLYAIQDMEFDRKKGLQSVPARFGICASLWVSGILHIIAAGLFVEAGMAMGAGWAYFTGVGAAVALMAWEHAILRPSDLSRLDAAFFTMNGWLAVLMLASGLLDLAL